MTPERDWRDVPDDQLTSADITAMCSEGVSVTVAGPPRAVSVYRCHRHHVTATGMGIQNVSCCGEPMERVA